MKRILIATDGSSKAREAVGFGIELASEQEAAVTLLQVIPPTDWTQLEHGAVIRQDPRGAGGRARAKEIQCNR